MVMSGENKYQFSPTVFYYFNALVHIQMELFSQKLMKCYQNLLWQM